LTQQQWHSILFPEEFRFHIDFGDGCARVGRGRIEQFCHDNVIQCDHYGDGSVNIFGKIGHYGKTNLVEVNGTPNSQHHCEAIVVLEVVPFLI
jgi:hypothetical protein